MGDVRNSCPKDREELRARFALGERFPQLSFWGHHKIAQGGVSASCLSQWYVAPFVVDGVRYATSEHWMMAGKARLFGDDETRQQIVAAPSPGAAKALGRRVRGFDDATWNVHRSAIVTAGNVQKFQQNAELGRFLRATGTKLLVEASPVDRIWGIGLAKDDPDAGNPLKWPGLNLLGFALMSAREELRGPSRDDAGP